jgi:hypothetical protein
MNPREPIPDTAAHDAPSIQPAMRQTISLSLVVDLLGMTLLPLTILWAWHTELMQWWDAVVGTWADWLDLSIRAATPDDMTLEASKQNDGSRAPSQAMLSMTSLVVLGAYLMSYRLPDRFYPLATLLRGICIIQTTALLYFEIAPASFPYSISTHLQSQLEVGYLFMLAVPLMLAMGWGVLNVGRTQKYWVPLIFLAYFAVLIPHVGVIHALILDKFSLLFMPVLYFGFGLLLHLMIFVGMYGTLLSLTPLPTPVHAAAS